MIKFFRHIRKNLLEEGKTTKYLKYAIGEIILVVIGILIALQVNNWNENRLEQSRIKEYARSLVQDLNSDIAMLQVSMTQAQFIYKQIDSLGKYMRSTPVEQLSNTDLFILTHDALYKPFMWSRATIDELKSSGSLRYITNDSIEKRLVAYEAFSRHLDSDYEGDYSNYDASTNIRARVIDFNDPYFAEILKVEATEAGVSKRRYFESPYYFKSKENEFPLLTQDRALLAEFTNKQIHIQNSVRVRGFLEMPRIIEDAQELISMLKDEYEL